MSSASPAPSDMAAPVAWDPSLESDFEKAMDALRGKRRGISAALLLIGSLCAFILLNSATSRSAWSIGVLVGVLLFHELGHYVGMRFFGYRDVRMFFIPFFGAAVSGKRAGAAAWKEGVVLLLGPAPGILLGLGILLLPGATSAALQQVSTVLIALNGFNLLPLAGLDGARLLQLIVFSRHPLLEIVFLTLACLSTVGLAILDKSIPLGVLAYLMVISLPYRGQVLFAARRLRTLGLALPAEARALEGDPARAVFLGAWGALNEMSRARPRTVASTMELVFEAATDRPPPLGATFALGVAYFAFLFLAVVGILARLLGPLQ